jgi:hypothetical protein
MDFGLQKREKLTKPAASSATWTSTSPSLRPRRNGSPLSRSVHNPITDVPAYELSAADPGGGLAPPAFRPGTPARNARSYDPGSDKGNLRKFARMVALNRRERGAGAGPRTEPRGAAAAAGAARTTFEEMRGGGRTDAQRNLMGMFDDPDDMPKPRAGVYAGGMGSQRRKSAWAQGGEAIPAAGTKMKRSRSMSF